MKVSTKKWVRPEQGSAYEEGLEKLRGINTYGFSEPVLEYLMNRGITTKEGLDDILQTGKDREHSPFEMKDMEKAVKVLQGAIKEKKKVVIYGDYDVGATRL